jgi:hypothetical protein
MPDTKQQSSSPTPADEEVIRNLRADIAGGTNWYIALLGAVHRWQSSLETFKDQTYRYIIADEALDFMLLAQRLLEAIDDLVPEDEQLAFLFRNKPPMVLTIAQFKEHLGEMRYKQYLNYFYGITAEEALIQALEDEVHKEEHGLQLHSDQEQTEEAYRRIYDQSRKELLREFRRIKGYPQTTTIELSQMKEFYYWLFQKRLQMHEKAKTASDTKKALDWLNKNSGVMR